MAHDSGFLPVSAPIKPLPTGSRLDVLGLGSPKKVVVKESPPPEPEGGGGESGTHGVPCVLY